MNKYEKVSIFLSIAAVIISILSPFLTYFWLDPTLKAFSLRGRLQVSSNQDHSSYQFAIIESIIRDTEVPNIPFDISILNIGQLPASGIQIVAHYEDEAKDEGLTFQPPVQYEAVLRGTEKFITLKRPLAAQDKLKVIFSDHPSKIAVSNEYGETSILDTGLGSFRREAAAKKIFQKKEGREFLESLLRK
jgi:hypothetical protein